MSLISRLVPALACAVFATSSHGFFPVKAPPGALLQVASAASSAPVERLRTIPEDARKGVMWPPRGRKVRINDHIKTLAPARPSGHEQPNGAARHDSAAEEDPLHGGPPRAGEEDLDLAHRGIPGPLQASHPVRAAGLNPIRAATTPRLPSRG